MIEIDGATLQIGGRVILERINARLGEGELVLVAGENGSGKTMLLRLALGLVRATAGTVRVDGRDAYSPDLTPRDVYGTVGVPSFMDWRSARANLRCLAPAGLQSDYTEPFGDLGGLKGVRARRLSMGQRQRVGLALAFAMEPRNIVLDEPTNGLDAPAVATLVGHLALLASAGRTVLIATHQLEPFEQVASRCIIVSGGRIVGDNEKSTWKEEGLRNFVNEQWPSEGAAS